MVKVLSKPHNLSTDVDHRVVAFPTRPAGHIPIKLPTQSGSLAAADRRFGVRTHVIREVVVLEVVAGRLGDVVDVLDRVIQMALAEGPRGVVCDLSAVLDGAEPRAVEMLATAGRHVRDWSGIPVAVTCPDPRVREALAAHPLGAHLIVTGSMFSAVSMVLESPTLQIGWLRLAPHPTAPRASRNFVTRTLLDWGLNPLLLSANLVVNELATNAMIGATNDIDVSVAWDMQALRLTVRDDNPNLPGQLNTGFDPHGRRLTAVTGLARAFGVLRTADGGKVVWAVLNAAHLSPAIKRRRPKGSTLGPARK